MALSLLEGNEAIAYGAIFAGCRFFAGYPITPANTIFSSMIRLLPPIGEGDVSRERTKSLPWVSVWEHPWPG